MSNTSVKNVQSGALIDSSVAHHAKEWAVSMMKYEIRCCKIDSLRILEKTHFSGGLAVKARAIM